MATHEPLSCLEVFDRLDDYLDRELSAEETRRVLEHLEACDVCAREYRFEGTVLQSLKEKVRKIHMPDALRERVLRDLGRVGGVVH